MEENFSRYFAARNLLSALDIVLAFLIIIFSSEIITTPLGNASVLFGFIMLTIVTVLKIFQLW